MNFGRRIPQQIKVIPNEKTEQAPTNQPGEPVPSFFNQPISSRELIPEINLFIPQVLLFGISLIVGLIAIVLSRVMIAGILNPYAELLTEEMLAQINLLNIIILVAILIPIVCFGLFLFLKMMLFMPRKDRDLTIRLYGKNSMLLTVEKISSKMRFNPRDAKTEIMITDPTKHFNYLTGRPIICLRENERTNISFQKDLDISNKGKDTDSLVANALHTGYEIAREQSIKREDELKKVLILLIVVLGAIGLLGFFIIKMFDQVALAVSQAIGAVQTAPALVRVV